jgi:hypothetical protein
MYTNSHRYFWGLKNDVVFFVQNFSVLSFHLLPTAFTMESVQVLNILSDLLGNDSWSAYVNSDIQLLKDIQCANMLWVQCRY